jgi:hypothetical protein
VLVLSDRGGGKEEDGGANAMTDYTNVTAANCTTATTPTLKELHAMMRTWAWDRMARVCRFNLDAQKTPCSICDDVMEMNDRGEIGVCEHVMAAIRREFGQTVDLPTIWPIGSPLAGVRIYVKQEKE